MSVIGNGVVIDPWALLKEIDILTAQGVKVAPENLLISLSAGLILPIHQKVDQVRERLAAGGKIGTTGRGIGPAYEDKVARRGLRMADLQDKETLGTRARALLAHHNVFCGGPGKTR